MNNMSTPVSEDALRVVRILCERRYPDLGRSSKMMSTYSVPALSNRAMNPRRIEVGNGIFVGARRCTTRGFEGREIR